MDYLYGTLCEHVSQNDYVLPIASKDKLGGVKIDGTSITIDTDGTIHSAGGASLSAGDGIKIENDIIEVKDTINKDLTFNGENIEFLEGISIGDYATLKSGAVNELNTGLKIESSKEIHINSEDGIFLNGGKAVNKNYVDEAIEAKQDRLTAGENITISEDGVISSTNSGPSYTAGNGIYIGNSNDINVKYDDNIFGLNDDDELIVLDGTFAPVEKPNFAGDIEVYASAVSQDNEDEEGTGVRASAHTKIEPNRVLLTSGSASAYLKATRTDTTNRLIVQGTGDSQDIIIGGVADPQADNDAVNRSYAATLITALHNTVQNEMQTKLSSSQLDAINSGINADLITVVNNAIASLDDNVDDLSSDISYLKAQIGSIPDGRTDTIEEVLANIQTRLSSEESTIAVIQSTAITNINNSIEELSGSIDNISESIDDITDDITTIQSDILEKYGETSIGLTTVTSALSDKYDKTGGPISGNVVMHGTLSVDGDTLIKGTLDTNSHRIINLSTPIDQTDAATKYYVDTHSVQTVDVVDASTSEPVSSCGVYDAIDSTLGNIAEVLDILNGYVPEESPEESPEEP